jgi:hypothetical protein
MRLECLSLTGWASAALQILLQWRWDNDRDALLAEEELNRQREKSLALEKQKQRQTYLATLTLDAMKSKKRFVSWEGAVSDELIEVCRQVFLDAVDALMEREGKPRKKQVVSVLRECVKRLNQLDAERHFIDTIDRGDLCREIDEIACACGFPHDEGIADRWRDW